MERKFPGTSRGTSFRRWIPTVSGTSPKARAPSPLASWSRTQIGPRRHLDLAAAAAGRAGEEETVPGHRHRRRLMRHPPGRPALPSGRGIVGGDAAVGRR